MASVSLRAYQQKIENLVDRGQTEEAVAHCKHILKLFPKHVDTYRLLGKAYLEMQHFQEAGDVLQRVLSVFPDDFVSQIGLSIIREDADNLDQAIWHMERAFEIQPSNNAVQEELKRLFGRRDGAIPQKILLTRGALVRMYVRGEAYPQAIAEGLAALQEDPQRTDIELLLAKSYLRTNQISESFRLCQKILQTLPYAFEANQLMAEMHILTKQNDQAEPFLERIRMLDPYAAFVNETTPTSTKVDENAILIDELDQEAISMNLALYPTEESALLIDDSLDEIDFQGISLMSSETQDFDSDDGLDMSSFNKQTDPSEELQIADTEEDDQFLQNLMNAEESKPAADQRKPEIEAISIPEFLQSMTSEIEAEQKGDIETHSSAIPQVEPLSTDNSQEEPPLYDTAMDDLPDWLKALDQETRQSDIELDLQNEIDSLFNEDGIINGGITNPVQEQTVDDDDDFTSKFLDELDDTSQQPGRTRMFSMTANLTPDSEQSASESDALNPRQLSEDQPETEIPDWLKELNTEESLSEASKNDLENDAAFEDGISTTSLDEAIEPTHSMKDMPSSSDETDQVSEEEEAFSWLESLAAKQGAAEDSLLSEQEDRPAAPPDWILQESAQSSINLPSEDSIPVDTPLDDRFTNGEELSPLTISSLEQEFPGTDANQTGLLDQPDSEAAWIDEFEVPESQTVEESENHAVEVAPDSSQEPALTELNQQEDEDVPAWLKELEAQTSIYAASTADLQTQIEGPDNQSFFEDKDEIPEQVSILAKENDIVDQTEILPGETSALDGIEAKVQEDILFPETPLFFSNGSQDQNDMPESRLQDEAESIQTSDQDDIEDSLLEEPEQKTPQIQADVSLSPESDLPGHTNSSFDVPPDLVEELFLEEDSDLDESPALVLEGDLKTGPDSREIDLLEQARTYFNKSNYEQAFILIDQLIDREKMLDEVINELTKFSYDNPLDPGFYIRLGDAYIRNNEIQKALDMYQEAENLLQK
jgi:tetratricopeptide (TPR) repeat protein